MKRFKLKYASYSHDQPRGGVLKVFIEYPLNLGSVCISMFSVNLTFDKTLVMQFLLFFCKNRHFSGYKCVSIQNST